jgi:hypothetical protein
MPEPTATSDADADPAEDTHDGDDEDTAQDTPEPGQPKDDWEARYKEAQKVIGRQGAELRILRGVDTADDDEDEGDEESDDDFEEPADRSGPDDGLDGLARDSWALAEARYGEEAVDAYKAAYRVYSRAETPADFIAAFEAYHEIRSGGGSKADASAAADGAGNGKPKRQDAIEPRVDTNRSDASPDLDGLESQFEEAKAKGDLRGFVHAATSAMGFRGKK